MYAGDNPSTNHFLAYKDQFLEFSQKKVDRPACLKGSSS